MQVITDEANGPGLQDAVFGNGQRPLEDWVAKMTVLPGPMEQQRSRDPTCFIRSFQFFSYVLLILYRLCLRDVNMYKQNRIIDYSVNSSVDLFFWFH